MSSNGKKRGFDADIDSPEVQDFFKRFIHFSEKEYGLGIDGIKKLLFKLEKKHEKTIPISVFDNNELSILESVCKYLKEDLNLSYHKIAVLINRNDRTVWASYNNSLKKRKKRLLVTQSEISIPIDLLKNRRFTALEVIVLYLRENYNLNYHKIGVLLRRDERNIWSTYQRARKKNAK